MTKAILKVNVWPNHFTVMTDSKWREWLFHKLFSVKVMDCSRKEAVDVIERVSTPPRPGRVVELKHEAESVPRPKHGGRVVKLLPPELKKMKRVQNGNVRPM